MLNPDHEPAVQAGAALPSHLYVHVPFCASKCDYCDFASVAGAHPDTVELVFAGIRSELTAWSRAGLPGVLDTVYVGGGTPSLHPDHVSALIEFITETFIVRSDAEITVEANPDSVDPGTVAQLRAAGATRMSLGVQSMSDSDLRLLGRRHDARAARIACDVIVDEGLDLSVDLMCGIPGQTVDAWIRSLDAAVATGAVHVSVYPLSIEDGTALQVAVDNGLVPAVDEDAAASMMEIAEESLARRGFERYEVANYAAHARFRSRHNRAYWTGRQYMGVGPGAHGMVDGGVGCAVGLVHSVPHDSRVRFWAAGDVDRWLMGDGGGIEILTPREAAREDAMLGMRIREGIADELARRAGVRDVLTELAARDLVVYRDRRWTCTPRGWLLGNEVFSAVWGGE